MDTPNYLSLRYDTSPGRKALRRSNLGQETKEGGFNYGKSDERVRRYGPRATVNSHDGARTGGLERKESLRGFPHGNATEGGL